MNSKQIYQRQYQIAKNKLDNNLNEGVSDTLDRIQNAADWASLGLAGGGLAATATGVGAPAGAVATVAGTALDIANAATYGGRAIHSLFTGDVEKAKSHAIDAGLRALFAIPFIGDVAQAGKVMKAASTAAKTAPDAAAATTKALETTAKSAPETAAKVANAETAAMRTGKRVNVPQRSTRTTTSPQQPKVPSRKIPAEVPAGSPGKSSVSTKAKVEKTTGVGVGGFGKSASRTGKVVDAAKKVGVPVGVGVVAKTIFDKITGKDSAGPDDVPNNKISEPEEIPDRRVGVGVDLGRLGIHDPGDPAGSSKSVISAADQRIRDKFDPMWSISPAQREILRRGISESHDLKHKVKIAVNKYLNSPQGMKLNQHLEVLRKNLISN